MLLFIEIKWIKFQNSKIKFYLMQVHKKHSCSVPWEMEGRRVSPTTLTDTAGMDLQGSADLCPAPDPASCTRLLLSTECPSETIQWLKRLVFIKWGKTLGKENGKGPLACADDTSAGLQFPKSECTDHQLSSSQSPDSNVRSQCARLKRTDHISQAPLKTGAAWWHSPARQ